MEGIRMFCTQCGKHFDQAHDTKFCSSCGAQIEQEATPAAPAGPSRLRVQFDTTVEKVRDRIATLNWRKLSIFAGSGVVALALLIGGTVFAIDEYQITAKDKVELSTVLNEAEIKTLVDDSCAPAKELIISDSDRATYETQLTALRRYANSSNLRLVLLFQNNNYWTLDSLPDIDQQLTDDVGSALDGALRKNSRIQPEAYDGILASLTPVLRAKVLADCGIEEEFADSADFTATYNGKQSEFSSKADLAPWYPAGFNETADGSIAWRWVDRSADCYSCRWNHVEVIAHNGCYNGVYAETNFLHNGSVIGWDNDSLPSLTAGQKAILEFISYNDNADQTEAPTFTCHP
jgi:hypothetical protein